MDRGQSSALRSMKYHGSLAECLIATGDGTESFADESRLNGKDCAIVGPRIGRIAAPESQVLPAAQTRDQNSERDGDDYLD
jgi:hypothetical protein